MRRRARPAPLTTPLRAHARPRGRTRLHCDPRRAHALRPRLHRYNFYHSDGGGRDGFIRHVSEHQTSFNYVPKAPEFVGNR